MDSDASRVTSRQVRVMRASKTFTVLGQVVEHAWPDHSRGSPMALPFTPSFFYRGTMIFDGGSTTEPVFLLSGV